MLGLPGCNIEYSEVSLYGPGYNGEAGRLVEATDIPVCKGSRFTKSDWMLLDTFGIEKCLYISTSDAVIHRISLEREVSSSYKGEHAYVYLSPSGDYMYIIGAGCIYKSIYNREKGEFQTPNVFAGSLGQKGSAYRIPECADLLLSWCAGWKN